MHLRAGRGIELVNQLRALAEARLRIAHLLRNAIDILHLEGDVLLRSHLDHRHRVIRQMPQRHHSVAERRLALERDIGGQTGLAHVEDLVPSGEIFVSHLLPVHGQLHVQEHRASRHTAHSVITFLVENAGEDYLAGRERPVVGHDAKAAVRHCRAVIVLAGRRLHNPAFLGQGRKGQAQEGEH